MPNIIFKLNNGDKIKLTEEEFAASDLSSKLLDQTVTWIDLGKKGFQKHSLTSWDIEQVEVTP